MAFTELNAENSKTRRKQPQVLTRLCFGWRKATWSFEVGGKYPSRYVSRNFKGHRNERRGNNGEGFLEEVMLDLNFKTQGEAV